MIRNIIYIMLLLASSIIAQITLSKTTIQNQGYTFGFTADSILNRTTIKIYQNNTLLITTDTVTSTPTNFTAGFFGTGADTMRIELTDTASVKFTNMFLREIADSALIEYGDTTYFVYTQDISEVGAFDYDVAIHYQGRTGTANVAGGVVSVYALSYEPTIDFGTVTNTPTTQELSVANSSSAQMFLSYSGLSFPFSINGNPALIQGGVVNDFNVVFAPSTAGSYLDTLIITVARADGSPYSVILSGTYTPEAVFGNWFYATIGGGGWHSDQEIDPNSPSNMYLVTDLSGFWKSNNYGASWYSVLSDSGGVAGADIAVNPDTAGVLYQVNNAGIWKSSDFGENWTRQGTKQIYGYQTWETDLSESLDSANFSAIWVNPANSAHIYASTGSVHGVLGGQQGFPTPFRIARSLNAGNTWSYITGSVTTTSNAGASFSGHPTNASIVYAGTRQGLWKTTNATSGSPTWTNVYNDDIFAVAVNPTDGENVWLVADYDDGDVVLTDSYLRYSTNAGATWSAGYGNLPSTFEGIAWLDYDATGKLYVSSLNSSGSEYRMYSTTSKTGASWSPVSGSNNMDDWWVSEHMLRFDVSPSGQYILGGYSTSQVSDNYGASFTNTTSKAVGDGYYIQGADVLCVNTIAISPGGEYILRGHQDNAALFSKDGGKSWNVPQQILNAGYKNGNAVGINPYDSTNMYIFATLTNLPNPLNNKLWRSLDAGTNWSLVNQTETWNQAAMPGSFIFLPNGRIFVNTSEMASISNKGVYYTDNKGVSWTKVPLSGGYYGGKMAYNPVTDVLYAPQTSLYWGEGRSADEPAGLVKIINCSTTPTAAKFYVNNVLNGVSGVAYHPNPDSSGVLYVSVDGQPIIGGNGYDSKGIFKTTDDGTTWTQKFSTGNVLDQGAWRGVFIDPTNTDRVFGIAGRTLRFADISGSDGVIMSEDAGNTWTSAKYNLPVPYVQTGAVDNKGRLHVGTYSAGGYRLDKTSTAITAPAIYNVVSTENETNRYGDFSFDFTANNGYGFTAYAGISEDSTTISMNTAMTITGSSASVRFEGLDTTGTYFLKAYIKNSINQADTTNIDSLSFATITVTYDSSFTTPADNIDDGSFTSSLASIYTSAAYFGHDGASANDFAARFRNVTIQSGAIIDSAFVFFTSRESQSGATVKVRVYGEDNASPAILSTLSNYNARVRTTAFVDDDNVESFGVEGTKHKIYCTNVIQELVGSYTYTNGNVTLFVEDNGSTSGAYRRVRTYDNGDSTEAVLKIYYHY